MTRTMFFNMLKNWYDKQVCRCIRSIVGIYPSCVTILMVFLFPYLKRVQRSSVAGIKATGYRFLWPLFTIWLMMMLLLVTWILGSYLACVYICVCVCVRAPSRHGLARNERVGSLFWIISYPIQYIHLLEASMFQAEHNQKLDLDHLIDIAHINTTCRAN